MRRTVLNDHPRVPVAALLPFPAMFSKAKKAQQRDVTPAPDDRDRDRLPRGAEAALWSIVETIPDPRNYLALTRDPTAEVRLSRREIDAVAAEPLTAWVPPAGVVIMAESDPTADRAEVEAAAISADRFEGVIPAAPTAASPRSEGIRWSSDTAEVRLPALAGPYDLDGDDASVHALEPAQPPSDPTRYAKGA